MKELKTIRDILQVLLEGYEIEELFEPNNTWESVSSMCFDTQYLDDEETVQGRYRIKTKKPSIDWSQVNEKYKYLAKDRNGTGFLYENRPKLESEDWWPEDNGSFAGASVFQSLDLGNCDWTESLVERPTDV